MTKWYVNTGRLATVISRQTPRAAAMEAIRRDISRGGCPHDYGNVTEVNETGQKINFKDGKFFLTPTLLSELGFV